MVLLAHAARSRRPAGTSRTPVPNLAMSAYLIETVEAAVIVLDLEGVMPM